MDAVKIGELNDETHPRDGGNTRGEDAPCDPNAHGRYALRPPGVVQAVTTVRLAPSVTSTKAFETYCNGSLVIPSNFSPSSLSRMAAEARMHSVQM